MNSARATTGNNDVTTLRVMMTQNQTHLGKESDTLDKERERKLLVNRQWHTHGYWRTTSQSFPSYGGVVIGRNRTYVLDKLFKEVTYHD